MSFRSCAITTTLAVTLCAGRGQSAQPAVTITLDASRPGGQLPRPGWLRAGAALPDRPRPQQRVYSLEAHGLAAAANIQSARRAEAIGAARAAHVSKLAAAASRRALAQVPVAATGRLAGHAAVVNQGARACEKWENERKFIDSVTNEPAATQQPLGATAIGGLQC